MPRFTNERYSRTMKTINLSKRARALLTLIGSWKIYHVFKMKAHFLLVASLLQFVCWEKLTSRLSGYSKRLTAKIAYFKDIEAALNACVSVRDCETSACVNFWQEEESVLRWICVPYVMRDQGWFKCSVTSWEESVSWLDWKSSLSTLSSNFPLPCWRR